MICDTVSKEQFKTTPESKRKIEDLTLAAAINKAMIELGVDAKVFVDNHTAFIETKTALGAEGILVKEIKKLTETYEGISDVKIKCNPIVTLSE